MREIAQDTLMSAIDSAMALVPRTRPSNHLLSQVKLIAHRGATHDADPKLELKENTLEAFERALRVGAWGLEFDVRFTLDDVPVIHHDRSTRRVFGRDFIVEETSFEALRKCLPEIPMLSEFVARFRSRGHFMLEIKRSPRALDQRRLDALAKCVADLASGTDYHLMSLDPRLLLACEFAPKSTLLPVAQFNVHETSKIALSEKMAGITGQYVLLGEQTIKRHHEADQKIGSGFINSRSVFYREVGRGMDWIFTNHIARITENYLKPPGM